MVDCLQVVGGGPIDSFVVDLRRKWEGEEVREKGKEGWSFV